MAGIFNRKQAGPEWMLPYQHVPGLLHINLQSLVLASILILSDWFSLSPSHETKSATSALRRVESHVFWGRGSLEM